MVRRQPWAAAPPALCWLLQWPHRHGGKVTHPAGTAGCRHRQQQQPPMHTTNCHQQQPLPPFHTPSCRRHPCHPSPLPELGNTLAALSGRTERRHHQRQAGSKASAGRGCRWGGGVRHQPQGRPRCSRACTAAREAAGRPVCSAGVQGHLGADAGCVLHTGAARAGWGGREIGDVGGAEGRGGCLPG